MLKGKERIRFNADTLNTELLFRIIHSANQLSIYGAVSKCCEEFGLKPEERGPKFADKENSVNGEMLKSVASQGSEIFRICSMDESSIQERIARKSSEL